MKMILGAANEIIPVSPRHKRKKQLTARLRRHILVYE